MTTRARLLGLMLVFVIGLGGCPQPSGSGNGDNSNNNGGATVSLSDAQKTALTDVAQGLVALGEFSATLANFQSSQLNLSRLTTRFNEGTCPRFTVLTTDTSAVARLDYGAGCSSAATGNKTISGTVDCVITLGTLSVECTLSNLVIDGAAVTGTVAITVARSATDSVTLTGTANLTVAGIGTVAGAISIVVNAVGLITISSSALTLTDAQGAAYSLTLSGLVCDPVNNGNFIPEAGTASFALNGSTIVASFDSGSPSDGTVSVTVGNQSAGEFDVPGI